MSTTGHDIPSVRLRGVHLEDKDNRKDLQDILDWVCHPGRTSLDVEVKDVEVMLRPHNTSSTKSQRDMFRRIQKSLADAYSGLAEVARSSVLLELHDGNFGVSATVGSRRRIIPGTALQAWRRTVDAFGHLSRIYIYFDQHEHKSRSLSDTTTDRPHQKRSKSLFPGAKAVHTTRSSTYKLGGATTCDPLKQHVSRHRACASFFKRRETSRILVRAVDLNARCC